MCAKCEKKFKQLYWGGLCPVCGGTQVMFDDKEKY